MSLTVSQLMELPCLRRAKIIAGHKSADRIVTSVSVLEYATPTDVQQSLYESMGFWGSELVITGFCSIANDVDAQCENIRKMAQAGEVGMILYYVGVIIYRHDDDCHFYSLCNPVRRHPGPNYLGTKRYVQIRRCHEVWISPRGVLRLFNHDNAAICQYVLIKEYDEAERHHGAPLAYIGALAKANHRLSR